MPRWPGPRKYDPWTAYLAQVPDDQVTLTLAEIEVILDAPLPPTAHASAFWSNYPRNPPSRAWRRVGWRVAWQPGNRWVEAVTFVRAPSASPLPTRSPRPRRVQPAALPPKYGPLTDFLRGVAADQIMLTLPEIEQIIGRSLPRTAWARGWWMNVSGGRQARAWLTAGWQVVGAALEEGSGTVTLTRVSPDARAEPVARPRP
jgi:hypothetical protein